MRRPLRDFLSGRGVLPWPVLVLLVAAAVVPSAAVLWFMNEALANEREALQSRLLEAYRGQLSSVAGSLRASWRVRRESLEEAHEEPWETFARLHSRGLADAAVILDERGRVLYPDSPRPSGALPLDGADWMEAAGREDAGDPADAAGRYGRIAGSARTPYEAAHALRSQARNLAKAGRRDEAMAVLLGPLGADKLTGVRDGAGRLVVPDALLLAVELAADPAADAHRRARERLLARLARYGPPHLPASQRRFLYAQLRAVWPACPSLPALEAEALAAEYVAARRPGPLVERLAPSVLPGVLTLASPQGRVVALYREPRVVEETQALLAREAAAGTRLALVRPGETTAASAIATTVGGEMGDWGLALQLVGSDPSTPAFVGARSTYVLAAALFLATIAGGSVVAARLLGREVRLTRLKNDLIATVSHEMRTPVASMRILLDNLIDGGAEDPRQVREYVELLSKENLRLAAIVESFLTFSRLERRRWKLERMPVAVDEIVRGAVEPLGDRLRAPGCELTLEVPAGLPAVQGDRGALVTVVGNLIENALKYSGESKRIAVRARTSAQGVCIEVEDNGVGFSRREARRLFEPFYQVDRRLSRTAGGCGLGLSIVKSIVEAHEGLVEARGEPGKGATFSVTLPA
jgi:signal transduction histidine kinase